MTKIRDLKSEPYFKGTPSAIDGTEDGAWLYAPEYHILNIFPTGDSPNDGGGAHGYFKLLWDKNNLYLLVHIWDDTRFVSGALDAQQDCLEIFFDPLYNRSQEGYGSPNNGGSFAVTVEAGGNSSEGVPGEWRAKYADYKLADNGKEYILEMAVPVSKFTENFEFAAGNYFGFDIILNDAANGEAVRNYCQAWHDGHDGTIGNWARASATGTLIISSDKAETVSEKEANPSDADAVSDQSGAGGNNEPAVKVPQTGDGMESAVYIFILILSAAVGLFIIKKPKVRIFQ